MKKLTISGGEPMVQCSELAQLLKYAKNELGFETCVHSGYTYEEILSDLHMTMCLNYIDVLIDGRMIDVKKSIKEDKVILLNSELRGD